jgi:hypothetical protein
MMGRSAGPGRRWPTVRRQGKENAMTHVGRCFCGAVEVAVSGTPEAMGYCHCRSCRSWSGAPPTLAFVPGVHANYAETVLPMRDGLPKLKDFPAELGGSGEAIAE